MPRKIKVSRHCFWKIKMQFMLYLILFMFHKPSDVIILISKSGYHYIFGGHNKIQILFWNALCKEQIEYTKSFKNYMIRDKDFWPMVKSQQTLH